MSDKDSLDREPIELVEVILPKCANVYGEGLCSAALGTGAECFNTRATCQAPNSYRDTPDRHLDTSFSYTQGDTIAGEAVVRNASLFGAADIVFASDPDGIIWEYGDTIGAYLGVDTGNLVFEVTSGSTTVTVSVDAAQFTGMSLILYWEIAFVISTSVAIKLWAFDPIELTMTLLGEDSGVTAVDTVWAGTGGGGVGQVNGTTLAGRETANWNGTVVEVRLHESQAAPTDMSDNFRNSLWLGRGVKGEPIDEKYIFPCLGDVGSMGTRINLNAADDNYEPLGRRATLSFTASDFNHSDITQDPYRTTRNYDPNTQGTFWAKWLVRQKFGKVGALVRVYDGYAGQRLADYKVRAYVMDKVTRMEDGVDFFCRDVLSRTEFRKATIPPASSGVLHADIDAVVTSLEITGDVTLEYPATGTIRVNDELMTYTGRSAAGSPVTTTFTGLSRGADGSTAADHEVSDLVQVCRRYTAAKIDNVLKEWLIDDANIEAQLINIAEIEDEVDTYLDAYNLTTLLTEPFGVDDLIGRLSEECSFYVFWDERSQQIRLKAIRAVANADIAAVWTEQDNIVANSLTLAEKPKERLNVITVYYNPLDFAGNLNEPGNFKNGLQVINGTSSLPEQYGNLIQSRVIYSIFLTTEAEANQTSSRLTVRYADVPIYAEFYVDAKDRNIWVGDVVQLQTTELVNARGESDLRNWLVVEAEEVDPGHLVRYVCADITLDGRIFFITENSVTEYTEALFLEGNAFITDNDGLNPDGTNGARIT